MFLAVYSTPTAPARWPRPNMESTVRGSGKPLPGATSVTTAIWHQLSEAAGGLTRDQIVSLVEPRVPKGYAWRLYLNSRKLDSKASTYPTFDTHHRRARALRYCVSLTLKNMVASSSVFKRPDGTYVALRRPKSAMPEDKQDASGDIARRHVAQLEAWRVLGPALARYDGRDLKDVNKRYLRGVEWMALKHLYEAWLIPR